MEYPPAQCKATFEVTKDRTGQMDPALRGGTFTATTEQSADFASVP